MTENIIQLDTYAVGPREHYLTKGQNFLGIRVTCDYRISRQTE